MRTFSVSCWRACCAGVWAGTQWRVWDTVREEPNAKAKRRESLGGCQKEDPKTTYIRLETTSRSRLADPLQEAKMQKTHSTLDKLKEDLDWRRVEFRWVSHKYTEHEVYEYSKRLSNYWVSGHREARKDALVCCLPHLGRDRIIRTPQLPGETDAVTVEWWAVKCVCVCMWTCVRGEGDCEHQPNAQLWWEVHRKWQTWKIRNHNITKL